MLVESRSYQNSAQKAFEAVFYRKSCHYIGTWAVDSIFPSTTVYAFLRVPPQPLL